MNSNTRIRIIIIAMFLLTGSLLYIAYTKMQENISGLVQTVKESTEPDLTLLRIKELWSGINNVSNNIRAYTVTRDESYLAGFLSLKDSLKNSIDNLKVAAKGSGKQAEQILQIEQGFNRKISVYDSLLEINYNRVLSGEIDKLEEGDPVSDTLQILQEEGNLFQRTFSSKYSRKTLKARSDSLIEVRNLRLQGFKKDVKRIREEEAQLVKEQSEKELRLLEADKMITRQMESVIRELENDEQQRLLKKATASKMEAADAEQSIKQLVIGGFSLIVILLLFVLRDLEISGRRRRELIAAKQKAEKLARAKEEFMSTMSHEIRTPLTSVIGFSEKLRQTNLDEIQLRFMKAIIGSSEHLLSIVNDVLDFTRVDSGKLKFDNIPFRAADIFIEVHDSMIWKAHEKNIELNLFIQPIATLQLHGDPVRLRQVLFNLIGNAIKFTEKGSVDITGTFLDENGKAVLLCKISDTGIGIPEDRLGAIFNEFEQADSSTEKKYGGSGLGLSISKRIVEQQGGEIGVESIPGVGSIFGVRIPYSHGFMEARETSYIEEPVARPLDGLTVLLAEDDPLIRELQLHSLESLGATVLMAENGKIALDLFRENNVSFILMDIQMPELTGPEALRIIRNEFPEPKKNVPVIAMTANVLQHDLKRYMDEGMNDFITKPFREAELVEKISKLISIENKSSVNIQPAAEKKEIAYTFNLKQPDVLLDLKELIATSQGNEDFVKKMINLFLTSSFASVNNLKFHLKRNNWEQLGKTSHRMIGSYKQLGIDYVAAMLKELEETSVTGKELGKAAFLVSEIEKTSMEIFRLLKIELEKYN